MDRRMANAALYALLCTAWATLALVNSSTANAAETANPQPRKIDFEREVAPILRQRCVDCHGPEMQLADLRLDQRKFVLVDDEDRGLVKPGQSGESLLIQRLVDKQLGLIMPPTFPFFPQDKVGLPAAQIEVLKQWIDQGATWPEGVSLSAAKQPDDEPSALKALLAAIRLGDRNSVARLLADASLVNLPDRHGATPLMHATLYADSDLMRLLIDKGADVNASVASGATALLWGAGDVAKVRLLVKHGAKVDVRSELGRTPLLVASTYAGNAQVVELLLSAGANANDRDQFGETALTSASKRGDARLVEILLAAGADVATSGGGFMPRPPLAWAAEEGNVATIAMLLKHGANKDAKGLNAALFNASVRGPTEAVSLLLEHGASASAPSGFAGYTPLMGAAYSENSSVETIRLLLARGADISAKGATGSTAVDLARKRGQTKRLELLEPADAEKIAASEKSALPSSEPAVGDVRAAAEKSIALLQRCGTEFFAKSGCVACHQHSVTSLALAAARTRGLEVDEPTARTQVQLAAMTIKGYRDRFLERVDHPANSAPATGYLLWGLAAENYPADENTDAILIEMAGRQTTDGSWTAFGHRPPMEYSRVSATALAIRAMQLYGPPGLKPTLEARIARGREWLVAVRPETNTDDVFRLLGLAWSGASRELIQAQAKSLLAEQRNDGGWSQLATLASDSYATGLTLYALHHAGGVATSDPAYQRGVEYLLKTQQPDGSWRVHSRSFPFQPYFESGFPHGHDQWISAGATGFATAALIDFLPPTGVAVRK
jgi:ankyrin repeat protein